MSEDGTLSILSTNCRGLLCGCMLGNEEPRSSNRWSGVLRVLKLVVRNARESGMISASVRGPCESREEQNQLVLLRPRNSAILQTNPILRWTRVPNALSYEVDISQGITPIWTKRTVEECEVRVPSGLLEAGQKYFWTVRANLEDSIVEKTAAFRVLSEDSVGLLRKTLQRVDTLSALLDPWAQLQLKTLIYASFGVYDDAVNALIDAKLLDASEMERRRQLLSGLLGSMHVPADEIKAFGFRD